MIIRHKMSRVNPSHFDHKYCKCNLLLRQWKNALYQLCQLFTELAFCIGAGIDLTCCADVRVCSPDAKFSIREVRLGLAADVGTLQRFPKIVGFGSLVRELCLTGGEFISLVTIVYHSLNCMASYSTSTNPPRRLQRG